MSEKNRKRLQFANTFNDKSSEYWAIVIFSDDTKIEQFWSHRQGKIWRKKKLSSKNKNKNNLQSNTGEAL